MFTSKIFYAALVVAAGIIAANIWNGGNALETIAYAAIGGPVIGGVVWFMYGKIAAKLGK